MLPEFPISSQVAQVIRQKIADGEYRPGAWLPPERDLASQLSVSRPVVREALAQLAEEGLVVRKPGCRPTVRVEPGHAAGRGGGHNGIHAVRQTIAAVIPQRPSYMSAHAILCGMSSLLAQRSLAFDLSIRDSRPTPAVSADDHVLREREVLQRLAKEGVAGIVLWHLGGEQTLPALREVHDAGIPVVYVDRVPAGLICDHVGVDNLGGVALSVEHLLELGHRRIAYVTNTENVTAVREREEGYREALAEHGIRVDSSLVYATPDSLGANLAGAADYLIALEPRPTAAIVLNDLHAFELIRELSMRGVRVPEDISIVGFDDVECYSPHPATLTTVHQPFYQMGRRATQLLLRRIEEGAVAAGSARQHILLPTRLVVRSTTCEPRPQAAVPSGRPVRSRSSQTLKEVRIQANG